RATAMLVVDDVARLRQRVAAPRGVIALSALAVLLVDPLALYSIGAWLSVSAIAAVIWAGRATARGHWAVRALAPAAAATLLTAPPLAHCRAGRVFDHGSCRDDVPRRRHPRRMPLLDGKFFGRGSRGRSRAAYSEQPLGRDRRGAEDSRQRRREAGGGPVLATPRRAATGSGRSNPRGRRSPWRVASRRRSAHARARTRARRAARPAV